MLSAMAAAANLQKRPDRVVKEAEIEFYNPLHTGIDYRVEVQKDIDDEAFILIYDLDRLMAKFRYRFRAGRVEFATPTAPATSPRAQAAVWSRADLREGTEVSGKFFRI